MKLFLLIAGILVLSFVSFKVLDIQFVPTPSPTIAIPTLELPTDTPVPTDTPIPQQTTYFTTPLYCPQIHLQGVTPCTDANKTPVACVAQFHPDGSPVINLICGIPGNSNSVKGCVNYVNNPNIVVCP